MPYPIFAYAALVPWTYFVHALTKSTNSLVGLSTLITKVYFPRLVIPISAVLAGLVDFLIAFILLIVMMIAYGIVPTAAIWTLPFFCMIPGSWRLLYGLNPMAGVVEGFRWALLGNVPEPGPMLGVSVAW